MAKNKNSNIKVKKKSRSARFRYKQVKPQPTHLNLNNEKDNFRHIVRICSRDIPGYMSLQEGLNLVYGISYRVAKAVEEVFKQKYKKDTSKVGYLTDEDAKNIEEIVNNLPKYVPNWLLNRAKLRSGGNSHLIMADLQLMLRKDVQRLGKIKTYRGLRLQWGLPVRGQKTRSTFRKSTSVVGVTKRLSK
jgi:small subunit ribosomal protein S13